MERPRESVNVSGMKWFVACSNEEGRIDNKCTNEKAAHQDVLHDLRVKRTADGANHSVEDVHKSSLASDYINHYQHVAETTTVLHAPHRNTPFDLDFLDLELSLGIAHHHRASRGSDRIVCLLVPVRLAATQTHNMHTHT